MFFHFTLYWLPPHIKQLWPHFIQDPTPWNFLIVKKVILGHETFFSGPQFNRKTVAAAFNTLETTVPLGSNMTDKQLHLVFDKAALLFNVVGSPRIAETIKSKLHF